MPSTRLSLLRCFSLLVVGLLLPLVSSTKMTPHCADREMVCFANSKCINPNEDDSELTKTTQDNDGCSVYVQIRPYSNKKALIRLKSSAKSIKFAYSDALAKPLFGCDKDIVKDPPKELLNWEISKTGGIACEFMYESSHSDKLFDTSKTIVVQHGSGVSGDPTITGDQISQKILASSIKCDMDLLSNELTDKDDQMIYNEVDRRFNRVGCKSGETLVFDDNGQTKEADGPIQCLCPSQTSPTDACPANDKWQYTMKEKESGASHTITSPQNVACRLPGCSNCTVDLPCANSNKNHCPKSDKVEGCNILKCKDQKQRFIKINDEPATIEQVTCGQHGDDHYFRWILNETPVDSVECVDTVPCQDASKKSYNDREALSCDGCPAPPCQINITIGGTTRLASGVTCDGKTGQWKNGPTTETRDALVSCAVVAPIASDKTDQPATGKLGSLEFVAMGIGGLVILGAICILVFCLCIRPKQKKAANKKIKTMSTSKTENDPGLKTALPVGYQPPTTTVTNSDQRQLPVQVEVEVVEKTALAQTPVSKPKSIMMNTAILATTAATEQDPAYDDLRGVSEGLTNAHVYDKPKTQSDGSEPRSIKIGKNGEAYINKREKKRKSTEKKNEDSQSEAGTTKKDDRPPKPIETGPKPQVFPLNEKEEKIRKGATCKANQYPTLADVDSSWEDWDEKKAKAAGNMAAGKKQRKGKTQDRTKTVPTAVTPENPDAKPSVERTQATNTRHSVDHNNDGEDMGNLVTQMDTTVEQKDAEEKKK